jgi:hypothetical protein
MTIKKIAITKPRKPRHYINNKDLYEAMKIYKGQVVESQKENKPLPKITNYIGECILAIANRLATKGNFGGYTYRDEMISDGIENCIMYINNFNPDKYNNPFAYFTQIIKFSFIRRIQKEKKQQYVKIKNVQNYFTFGELFDEMNDRHDREIYDNNNNFVQEYENKLSEKKNKSKPKE